MAHCLRFNSTNNTTYRILPIVLNQTAFLAAMREGRFYFAVENLKGIGDVSQFPIYLSLSVLNHGRWLCHYS